MHNGHRSRGTGYRILVDLIAIYLIDLAAMDLIGWPKVNLMDLVSVGEAVVNLSVLDFVDHSEEGWTNINLVDQVALSRTTVHLSSMNLVYLVALCEAVINLSVVDFVDLSRRSDRHGSRRSASHISHHCGPSHCEFHVSAP